MRKWTERDGKCAAALRTDMAAVVKCQVHEAQAAMQQKSESGSPNLPKDHHPGVTTSRVNRVAGSPNVHAYEDELESMRAKWFIWWIYIRGSGRS